MTPRTKAGKQRKVAKVMHEWGAGDLRSSSGEKVTDQKQAVAIALSESGQARARRPRQMPTTKRLSDRLTARIGERDL